MEVLVCQHGSRHRYAIPRMLERAGLLKALYTDSTVYSRLGRLASWLKPLSRGPVRRLLNRVPHGIPRDKVYSTDRVFWFGVTRVLRGRSRKADIEYRHWCHVLSAEMTKWGLEHADAVYNMYCENLVFVRHAKEHGLRVITEVYVSPMTPRIMAEACKRFPDWAPMYQSRIGVDAVDDEHVMEMVALSDLLVCPSQWVVDGLVDFGCDDLSRVAVVPYGCSIDYDGRRNRPVMGRVLFVGTDALRKGLPYLGEAASQLRAKGRDYDFRIAGIADDRIERHALCRELNFLGKLTGDQMKSEYLAADVFVLPTLSEGFASACIEAMTAGVPVITTRCAGTTIDSGVDGMIVPEGTVGPLAEAIDCCIRDRALRDSLAERALASAQSFSESQWNDRLLSTLGAFDESSALAKTQKP